MDSKGANLQNSFLAAIRKENISIQIFLVNGIRLVGHLEAFDAYIVLLKNEGIHQAIYKHAISTIVPLRPISQESVSATTMKKRTPLGLRRTQLLNNV